MISELKFALRNKKLLVTLIAIAIIPVLYISLFVGSYWNIYDKTEDLKISVVNKDEPFYKNNNKIEIGETLTRELEKTISLISNLFLKKQLLKTSKVERVLVQ
ncbi:hypothetical protein KJB58_11280 [Staphylococcus hyicus]|uniref:Uncharacterized protein n=1 Tax=Staphylococcus hyicus TaxID=1284 RepID=A0A418JIU5_STAHY|nr:hypothetical protein [Staphylococcus hyicus]MCE5155032.1 hypothetical protein [Staphylococcus hyicus]RIO45619.1 hypothetical protein BUZ57_07025 [Staphylococcus hyicus]